MTKHKHRLNDIIYHEEKVIFFRHTLVGVKLNGCRRDFSRNPLVHTSLLSKSVLNFVIKEMKGFCGSCGMENEGGRLNPYPWLVAIKERVVDAGITKHVYHTGIVFDKFYIDSCYHNCTTFTKPIHLLMSSKIKNFALHFLSTNEISLNKQDTEKYIQKKWQGNRLQSVLCLHI